MLRITSLELPLGHDDKALLEAVAVRQHWETTADEGVTWTTAFDAEYRPVGDGS